MPDDLARAVAGEVNRLLLERGLTVNAAAKASGLPQRTLARRLAGEGALDLDDVQGLCRALDVDPVDLLRWADG